MAEETNRKLRSLTDQYFEGCLEKVAYVSARGRLLDALAGSTDDREDEDRTVPLETVPSASDNTESSEPVSAPAPAMALDSATEQNVSGSSKRLPLVGGIGAVLVAVFALVFFLSDFFKPGENLTPPQGASVQPDDQDLEESLLANTEVTRTEYDSVRLFIQSPRWEEEDVAEFVYDWDLLSTAEQEEFRGSETFSEFVGKVRNRIKLENALHSSEVQDGLALAAALSMELGLGLVAEPGDSLVTRVGSSEVAPEELSKQGDPSEQEDPPEQAATLRSDSEPTIPIETSTKSSTVAEPDQPPATGAVVSVEADSPVETQLPATVEVPPEESTPSQPRYASDRPCSVERLNYRSAFCWDMLSQDVRGPVVRVIGAGEFEMGQVGDPAAEPTVIQLIERPFAIGIHEVSVEEFEYYCRESGAQCPERRWSGGTYPVVDVSWSQAVAYNNWLTSVTGAKYRLPTEAEWEYAARGGGSTLYPFGEKVSPVFARFDTGMRTLSPLPNDDSTTRKNEWQLWHMAGNVREWTVDPWRENYAGEKNPAMRVVRGGSYAEGADRLRSAARAGESVDHFDAKTGFRVVREIEPE